MDTRYSDHFLLFFRPGPWFSCLLGDHPQRWAQALGTRVQQDCRVGSDLASLCGCVVSSAPLSHTAPDMTDINFLITFGETIQTSLRNKNGSVPHSKDVKI